MTVFKTILKILNKLKGMVILYTAILVAITALNQTSCNNMTILKIQNQVCYW